MSWEIFDKFYNAHWFLTGYSCCNFSELLQAGGCTSLAKFIGIMENDVTTMIFDTEQFNQAANYYANKLINNNVWREKMYKKFNFYAEKYFEASEKLLKLDLAKLSDKQLVKEINKINKHYLAVFLLTKNSYLQFIRYAKGISQPDLHLEDIRKIKI